MSYSFPIPELVAVKPEQEQLALARDHASGISVGTPLSKAEVTRTKRETRSRKQLGELGDSKLFLRMR
jgi:hypothetical protein